MPETSKAEEKPYTVARRIDATPETLIIEFAPVDGTALSFRPGQFVMAIGIDRNDNRRHTARAFSIASPPSSPVLRLCVIKNPKHGGSVGRSHFLDAQESDLFVMKGPHGKFFFDPSENDKFLLLAAGTGVAPFLSTLSDPGVKAARRSIHMLYSVRRPEEIIEPENLRRIEEEGIAKVAVTVTRPGVLAKWQGKTGHIDEKMLAEVPELQERTVLICGSYEFGKDMANLLALLRVPADRIKLDAWG